MKNEITLQLRAFPVSIRDNRTGERSEDVIVLTKDQLKAALDLDMSSEALICRLYNRKGYSVQEIQTPAKREVKVDMGALFSGH